MSLRSLGKGIVPGASAADRRRAWLDREKRRNATSDHSRGGGGRPSFTAEEAAEIRRRLNRFESPQALAEEYGVSKKTILKAGRLDYPAGTNGGAS